MLPFPSLPTLFRNFGQQPRSILRLFDYSYDSPQRQQSGKERTRSRIEMAPREELLLILDLTSTVLRAGVGVADLIRGPLLVRSTPLTSPLSLSLRADIGISQLQELPTRLGRKLNTKGTQVEDYLVGHYLSEAERTGSNEHEVVYPLQVDPKVGFIVTDWVGLEAIL